MRHSGASLWPPDLLRQGAREVGVCLDSNQIEAFSLYAQELLRWNRHMNLTALREVKEVMIKHFLGSLAFLAAFPRELALELVDIGSGAGFPGIPIQIACPQLSITLIEASRKKVSFLRHICALLELRGIECVRARAEDLAIDPRFGGRFDAALGRAVGKRQALLEVAAPLLRRSGSLILSGKEEEEEENFPETPLLRFRETLRVRFPSLDFERKLLVWERRR